MTAFVLIRLVKRFSFGQRERKRILYVILFVFGFWVPFEALGYEPIPIDEYPNLVGNKVYPTLNEELSFIKWEKDVQTPYVFAGEELTLIHLHNFQKRGERNSDKVAVQKADGVQGLIGFEYLSKAPLAYNLTKPGKAEQLLFGIQDKVEKRRRR